MANDLRLRRILYPRFYPLHLFSYLNSWERASIFPFECSVLNKGIPIIPSLLCGGELKTETVYGMQDTLRRPAISIQPVSIDGMTSYGYCLFYIVWYDELWVLFVLYYMVWWAMGIVCFIFYGMTSYGYCLFYIIWYDELWVLFVLYYMVWWAMGIVCFILYGIMSYGYCLFYIVWYDEIWVLFVLYCIGMTSYGYCLFYFV